MDSRSIYDFFFSAFAETENWTVPVFSELDIEVGRVHFNPPLFSGPCFKVEEFRV